jgi:hypothetical protein
MTSRFLLVQSITKFRRYESAFDPLKRQRHLHGPASALSGDRPLPAFMLN